MKIIFSIKQLHKVTYAEKDKQSKFKPILRYLWKNRKTVIRLGFSFCWLVKKGIAWFES